MKNIIIIIVSIFILTSCNKDSKQPNNLEQTLIGSGTLSGTGLENIQKGNFIIEKVKPSGGYTIQIEELTETNNSIEALVRRSSPTGVTTQALTQPFYISKIEKPNRNIIFKE